MNPFPTQGRATTSVTVELSSSQVAPTLPFELKNYVTPNTWEIRVSTLTRLASWYCRPTLERAYVAAILVLTFLVPITAYYITFGALEITVNDTDRRAWLARINSFVFTVVTWIVLSVPILIWKYQGRVRVKRLADHWTKTDALSAASYGAAPVWKANLPGFFGEAIMLTVTVPLTKKSHFDRDSALPPYVSAGDDGLPSYGDPKIVRWSQDLKGGVKYGNLPIYTDDRSVVV